MKKAFLLSLLLIAPSLSTAAVDIEQPVIRKISEKQFMVSAMLRKNDQNATVKLVQSIEIASSKEEASGILLNRVKREFGGYSLLDVLISPVPIKTDCETWL